MQHSEAGVHVFNEALPKNNKWSPQKQRINLSIHIALTRLPRVVILLSFCSHIYSSSVVICPLHACPARQGSPGRTNPHRRPCSSPTIPPPPLSHSASSVPTAALPPCPASLPYDLDADKTGGPTVPSGWCQHFPLEQRQSRCVTYMLVDRKQLPFWNKLVKTVTFFPREW